MSNEKYIDLLQSEHDTHDMTVSIEDRRTSTLVMEDDFLQVMGELPHGYRFSPKTREDANKMIEWLENWKHKNPVVASASL